MNEVCLLLQTLQTDMRIAYTTLREMSIAGIVYARSISIPPTLSQLIVDNADRPSNHNPVAPAWKGFRFWTGLF